MTKKIIEINGNSVTAGDEVLLKVFLTKESGTSGIGYNLELPLPQGGAIIAPGKITLINIRPDRIIINEK